MDERIFLLMHKNDPVVTISIDTITGSILRVASKSERDLLPLGGCTDAQMLRKWWQRRAVPMSQGKIQHILQHLGLPTAQSYLVNNLGLSLSDHYWIKPADADFTWQDVNLYTNDFRDAVGQLQMDYGNAQGVLLDQDSQYKTPLSSYSPSSSLQGELRKTWIISGQKRCLIKGNHGNHSQESLNEVAAALVHKQQNAFPYVIYQPLKIKGHSQICCICDNFTSENLEFIPAIDVVDSQKKNNSVSTYEHFILVCTQHGLDESQVRHFLEYQIMTDYVLSNIDRHLNNFGVLRDTNTLQFVSMAPIFDTGNSMFWRTPELPRHGDLNVLTVNSFRQKEKQLLEYIHTPKLLDISKLPTPAQLREIYEQDPLIPCLDSILYGYERKIDMLESTIKQGF